MGTDADEELVLPVESQREGPWSKVQQEWVRTHGRVEDHDDEGGVRRVDAAEAATLEASPRATSLVEEEEAPRLGRLRPDLTPEGHRATAVDAMEQSLIAAELGLENCIKWGGSVNYHEEFMKLVRASLEKARQAEAMLHVQERP